MCVEKVSLIEFVPAPVNPSRRGVTSSDVTPPLSKRRSYLKICTCVEKKQQDTKPRFAVLERPAAI
jgi:hypothetical protein